MADEKEEVKKVELPVYGTKQQFLSGVALNVGKNFLIVTEVRDRKTGEFIDESQEIVYEKYVNAKQQYVIKNYNDKMQFFPTTNEDVVLIMKSVKPDVEDDIFTVKTAKGNTKRYNDPINM